MKRLIVLFFVGFGAYRVVKSRVVKEIFSRTGDRLFNQFFDRMAAKGVTDAEIDELFRIVEKMTA